jgi:hypothetical protein
MFVRHVITSISIPLSQSTSQLCGICTKNVTPPMRQNHMGKHILYQQRGITLEYKGSQVCLRFKTMVLEMLITNLDGFP